ncbi:MAG TPA: hypothetical protein PLF04_03055 [Candidatus Fermentibacter daniensis]|jgi:hypothetical protein|nr:hypothetical protein [Candidatus Fermentibacter daniensis]
MPGTSGPEDFAILEAFHPCMSFGEPAPRCGFAQLAADLARTLRIIGPGSLSEP